MGFASVLGPLLLSEISTPENRGIITSMHQVSYEIVEPAPFVHFDLFVTCSSLACPESLCLASLASFLLCTSTMGGNMPRYALY